MAFFRVNARGGSMWPTVRHGDVLLVDASSAIAVGDVVVLRARLDGELIAHRVALLDGSRLRCANAAGQLDPWLDVDAVAGRVVALERDGQLHELRRESRNVRMLWALRSGYGLARRAAHRLRRSFT